MSSPSLEDVLQTAEPGRSGAQLADRAVRLPGVPSEFSNWRDEQHAWRDDALPLRSVVPHDRPVHQGPGRAQAALRPRRQQLRELRRRQGQAVRRLQLRRLRHRRRDPLLSRRRSAQPRRPPVGAQLGAVPLRDRRLRRDLERDERAAVNPDNRRLYRYQVQGPTALEVLEKVNGGPLPEIKFFNMGEITIAGHKVRALHHGMSGVPGLELFGPWDEGDDGQGRASSRRARSSACVRSARASTPRTRSSRAGSRARCRRSSRGDEMKAYREWLPADGYEGTGSLGGSYYSDDIADYYLTPYDLGYGALREVRPRLHRPRRRSRRCRRTRSGRRSRSPGTARTSQRAMETMFHKGDHGEVHRPAALQLLHLAERPDHAATARWSACRRSPATAPTSARCSRSRVVDVEHAEPGTEVTLVWGEEGGGSSEARRRAPRADRDPRDRLARAVRRGRPRLVPAEVAVSMAADVELVGLYWTVSGPVEVHVGREWSLFDWADRCAEAREVGFSGHRDLARRPRARARDAQPAPR